MKTQLSVKHNFPYGHFIFIAFCLDENTTFRTVLETTFAINFCLDRTYFVEIENWKLKYCSKIIFKCMNNTVRPIFNEKITEK